MNRVRVWLLLIALVGWLACFVALAATGSWTPFAWFGVALAGFAAVSGALSRQLLRPSWRLLLLGTAAGTVMVVLTHMAYILVVRWVPDVAPATRELFVLLNYAGFSPGTRVLLISTIAACEELLFRGLLPEAVGGRRPTLAGVALVAGLTAAYALTTAPLGSPLLMACALVCGGLWAALRITTRSVVVPVLAHAIWDLGVLLVWPLV